jgi:serine/threonine protein kinase
MLAGRYEIDRLLGRGGMGYVLRAFDRTIGEAVAIKVLRPEYAQEKRWVERLAREVKLARKIRHPNVCRLFDFGQADGHTFVTMELATGGTLREVIDSAAERPIEDRIADAKAVVGGLAAIHEAGIVHRDITPQNVLRMEGGRLALTDFGLAGELASSTTSVHGGTVAYMAPEVLRGSKADRAADMWSLGVVLHELFFGTRPEWERGRRGLTMKIPAAATESAVTRSMAELCRRCTEEDPSLRLESPTDVLMSLEGARTIQARRFFRGLKISRRMAMLAVAVPGLLVTGAGVIRKTKPSPTASVADVLLLTGDAADWTRSSRVVASSDGMYPRCLSALPGGRSVRVIWKRDSDSRRRAEDIEISTGARSPSPILDETFLRGCPQLSPDGSGLIYEGEYRGQPHIFYSKRPDGRDAVPIVSSSEPINHSEPVWLPNGREFLFEPDARHAAVFSLSSGRTNILPDLTAAESVGFVKAVSADGRHAGLFYSSIDAPGFGVIYELPSLRPIRSFSLASGMTRGWQFRKGSHNFLAADSPWGDDAGTVIEVDLASRQARRLGAIPRNTVEFIVPLGPSRAVFACVRALSNVAMRNSAGETKLVTKDGFSDGGVMSERGDMLWSTRRNGKIVIALRPADGSNVRALTEGPHDYSPAFFPGGSQWAFAKIEGKTGIYRCDLGKPGCTRLTDYGFRPSVSPDSKWVAFIANSRLGYRLNIVSAHGSSARDVTHAFQNCAPIWSSPKTLWVLRNAGAVSTWVEVQMEDGAETGRRRPITQPSCADASAEPDPALVPRVWDVLQTVSQIRVTDLD